MWPEWGLLLPKLLLIMPDSRFEPIDGDKQDQLISPLPSGRRRVAEDMWIISVQQHEQSPHGPQGDTSIRGPSNYPFQAGGGGKPPDELPSYEEALKLPPIHSKDTTSHV